MQRVTTVVELIQQINAELQLERLPQLKNKLQAAFADEKRDHPSQLVFAAMLQRIETILWEVGRDYKNLTQEQVREKFNEMRSNFKGHYLADYLVANASTIQQNVALMKQLKVKNITDLSAQALYDELLSSDKKEIFPIIAEVYCVLAEQYHCALIALNDCQQQLNAEGVNVSGNFKEACLAKTRFLSNYQESPARFINDRHTLYDVFEDRVKSPALLHELNLSSYYDQMIEMVKADAHALGRDVNALNQEKDRLEKDVAAYRRSYDSVSTLIESDQIGDDQISRLLADCESQYAAVKQGLSWHADLSKRKKALIEKGKLLLSQLERQQFEVPSLQDRIISQQKIIMEIDSRIAELCDIRRDRYGLDALRQQQQLKVRELSSTVHSNLALVLQRARGAYSGLADQLNTSGTHLVAASKGQTNRFSPNPLWIEAADCVKKQLTTDYASQYQRVLSAREAGAVDGYIQQTVAGLIEAQTSSIDEEYRHQLNELGRYTDQAITELSGLRDKAMQAIALTAKSKVSELIPGLKNDARLLIEQNLKLLDDVEPLDVKSLNLPDPQLLREKFLARQQKRQAELLRQQQEADRVRLVQENAVREATRLEEERKAAEAARKEKELKRLRKIYRTIPSAHMHITADITEMRRLLQEQQFESRNDRVGQLWTEFKEIDDSDELRFYQLAEKCNGVLADVKREVAATPKRNDPDRRRDDEDHSNARDVVGGGSASIPAPKPGFFRRHLGKFIGGFSGAALGAAIGAGIGFALLPFTFGISVPLFAAIGGVIGGAVLGGGVGAGIGVAVDRKRAKATKQASVVDVQQQEQPVPVLSSRPASASIPILGSRSTSSQLTSDVLDSAPASPSSSPAASPPLVSLPSEPLKSPGNLGLFAYEDLPAAERSIIEDFEIALAKEILRIIWQVDRESPMTEGNLAKIQKGVIDRDSARNVIETNLNNQDYRHRVVRGIQNTIALPVFNDQFGALGDFQGQSMAELDEYLDRAYQLKHPVMQ